MGISIDEARRVAALAKLEFGRDEIETFTGQLSAILDYVDRLRQVDTTEIEPLTGAAAGEASLRPDRLVDGLSVDQALANAPEASAGHFRVPRVIG